MPDPPAAERITARIKAHPETLVYMHEELAPPKFPHEELRAAAPDEFSQRAADAAQAEYRQAQIKVRDAVKALDRCANRVRLATTPAKERW